MSDAIKTFFYGMEDICCVPESKLVVHYFATTFPITGFPNKKTDNTKRVFRFLENLR